MTCELCTSSLAPVADCLPTLSLGINPSALSNGSPTPAVCSRPGPTKGGFPDCTCTKEMCASSTFAPGPALWISSARASLVRIFQQQAEAQALKESVAALSRKSSGPSTKSARRSSGSKTHPTSAPRAGMWLSPRSWRVDTPGKTESLVRLMSAPAICATAGGASLPTLTVCGNYAKKGSGQTTGDGLATARGKLLPTLTASGATAIRRNVNQHGRTPDGVKRTISLGTRLAQLPMTCATDYESPYSLAGYLQQTLPRSNPLRCTLVHTTGNRLTPAFAEWWMGWPIGWTALNAPATGKSRSKRQQRG